MPKAEVGAAVRPLGAVGAVESTVQLTVAACGSTTLFTVAATEKVCAFWARPVKVIGLVQAVALAPSRLQVNVGEGPLAWKANVAELLVVPAGGALSM